MAEGHEEVHHNSPEARVTTLNCLFGPTNSPESQIYSVCRDTNREMQQIFTTLEKLPANQ